MRPAYDPTIYEGAAAHYARGRPPYSRLLAPALAGLFESAIGLDPDTGMLVPT